MKILFTADWHIKLGQKKVPKEWQTNRYYKLFEKLDELSKKVDLVIIGGDIFDQAPTLEELALFMDYVHGTDAAHIIYDGNHEATKKGHSFFPELRRITRKQNIEVFPNTIDCFCGVDFVPYTQLKNIPKYEPKSKILCTHVRGEILPHVKPEIDLSLLDKWEVVLAGDLHAYSNSQRNILYPGSPLSINFHRNPITNGVIIFDTDTLQHEWVELGLPQLIRKTVTSKDEIVETDYDHTIYEIEGSILELSGIANDLIDKKLSYKMQDSVLNLHKSMTIEDELVIYWRDKLELNENEISNLLKVFHDYNKRT